MKPVDNNSAAFLNEVCTLVKEFLAENGGCDNGYATFVSGEVRKHIHQSLTWNTPSCDKLTISEYKQKGYALNDSIEKLLHKYNIPTVSLVSFSDGCGCYSTTTTIFFGQSVL